MSSNRRIVTSEDQKQAVLEKIKQYEAKGFPEAGELHALIMQTDPSLCPRLWYGMPGYAKSKDSAVLFFFRKDKYITFGTTESIHITDNPDFIPYAFFAMNFGDEVQEKLIDTVKRAMK